MDSQEILPAFDQACQGDFISLQALLSSTTHIAYSLRTRYPVPLSGEESQRFLRNHFYPHIASLLDVPTLRRARAGSEWNPWEALSIIIPTLEGRTLQTLGAYGELLELFLLATLCCERPPRSASRPSQAVRAVIPHDEVMFAWREYTTRDAHTRDLWGMFDQPLPQELAQQWPREGQSQAAAEAKSHPRALPYAFAGESITGFITHEEVVYLLQQVQKRERPEPREALIGGCIRDGEAKGWGVEIETLPPGVIKRQEELSGEEFAYRVAGGKYIGSKDLFTYWRQTHPAEMEGFLQRYYKQLWTVEEEVLSRMHFAAARGWGILEAYS